MENRTRRSSFVPQIYQIQYVNFKNMAGILLSVVGLLTSLWANFIVVVGSTIQNQGFRGGGMYVINIIFTSQIFHFLISISCTAGLYYGLTEKNNALLTPWIAMKVLEILGLTIGSIMLTTGEQEAIALVPIGIIFTFIGGSIMASVLYIYCQLEETITVPNEETLSNCPPKYETCLHDINTETKSVQ